MVIAKLLYLCILFPVSVFIPGFLLTRNSRQQEDSRLILSVSLSLLVLFAASFLFYLLNLNAIFFILFSSLLLLAALPLRLELFKLFTSATTKRLLLHYAIFLTWILLVAMATRNYSSAGWANDWEEHYRRSLFFLHHNPLDTIFIDRWALTARPPLYNLLTAYFQQHLGSDFLYYQVTSILLNSLVFLGAWGVFQALFPQAGARRNSLSMLLMTLFLCLNPSVVQNVTLVWTRALTNFFILYGLALYILSLRDQKASFRAFAWLNLGLATVTHYSAAPYMIGLGMVEVCLLVKRKISLKQVSIDLAIFVAPLTPWLTFALYHFGARGTFMTNSTVTMSPSGGMGGMLITVVGNIISTLIPHPARSVEHFFQQGSWAGYIRDYTFLIYQVNFPFMLGSFGGMVALWLLLRAGCRQFNDGRQFPDLLLPAFVIIVLIVGIAAHGPYDPWGVGHICLQPLAIIGVLYLSSQFMKCNLMIRSLLGIGLLIDLFFGIVLQFYLQHFDADRLAMVNDVERIYSWNLFSNAFFKAQKEYVFMGDGRYTETVVVLLSVLFAFLIYQTLTPVQCKQSVRTEDKTG